MPKPPREYRAPHTPQARLIEDMKAAGLLEVRPEDRGKPWAEQRLQKTPAGESHEAEMRRLHPDWFEEGPAH